jgi:ubiquinone/menaquinone biosynthesis C-methylase UbiE
MSSVASSIQSSVKLVYDTETLAHNYERLSADRQFKSGQNLISELGIAQGETVLDVGSGTGLLAEYTANAVGVTGAVVGIDPLPLRVELAKQRSRSNLSFAVGDANDLSIFADESFDVVYLNAVFHWLHEKISPLREFHRVLKAGGRLGIATADKEHKGMLQSLKAEVLSREPYRNYPEALNGSAYSVNLVELVNLLDQTCFAVQKIELQPSLQYHLTEEVAIAFSEASSFGNFLGHLPQEIRAAARADIAAELKKHKTSKGIGLDGVRILAIATKR